jgi:gluconate kinase
VFGRSSSGQATACSTLLTIAHQFWQDDDWSGKANLEKMAMTQEE